jgi:hypothetical protein
MAGVGAEAEAVGVRAEVGNVVEQAGGQAEFV